MSGGCGGGVTGEQVSEVGGSLVVEGFVGEEKDLNWMRCGTGSQWSFWRTGVMWSRVRVSRRAAEFWMF